MPLVLFFLKVYVLVTLLTLINMHKAYHFVKKKKEKERDETCNFVYLCSMGLQQVIAPWQLTRYMHLVKL